MSLPVRCFTCGKVIGQYELQLEKELASQQEKIEIGVQDSIDLGQFLDSRNMTRYCCRRMFLGYVPILDKVILFPSGHDSVVEKDFSLRPQNL